MSIPGCRSAYFNVENACLARVSRFSRVDFGFCSSLTGHFHFWNMSVLVYGGVLHLAADPFTVHKKDKIRSVGLNLIRFFIVVGLRIVLCYRSVFEGVINVS
jgi:hypothetical protein